MRFTGPLRAALALLIALAAVGVAIALLGDATSTPLRPGNPVSMFQDNVSVLSSPTRTLRALRSLGVERVRLSVEWSTIAPGTSSPKAPRGLRAGDPASYPSSSWASYDAVVKAAHAEGIDLDLILTGAAPRWATSPGASPAERASGVWEPSPAAYGEWVHAIATRYDGTYRPPGASLPLPGVHTWEIWNEPNWGPTLQPQMALHPFRVSSAVQYRHLVDAAWAALQRSGHDHDTVVIGNLSPRGVTAPPDTALQAAVDVSGPRAFTRTLYCVDGSGHLLRGPAALRADCPTTAAGSRGFRNANPALFEASGFGVHPYPIGLPPTQANEAGADTVQFSEIPQFARLLDDVHRVYGSSQRMAVYNTEFGYITNPPNPGTEYVSPATAALYLNWTEYLTWRNPRIASTMQYLLYDPNPKPDVFGPGGFASGLIFYGGRPKADFYAYRMPIYLPVTRASPGRALEVWGCARPAPHAYDDTHRAQDVEIQFRDGSGGSFQTVRTVRLATPGSCYFDAHVRFPGSGTVRLQWSYPPDDHRLRDPIAPTQKTIVSRDVSVTVR